MKLSEFLWLAGGKRQYHISCLKGVLWMKKKIPSLIFTGTFQANISKLCFIECKFLKWLAKKVVWEFLMVK